MPDLYYVLDDLWPYEALQILADTASSADGRGLGAVKVRLPSAGLEGAVALVVPHVDPSWPIPGATAVRATADDVRKRYDQLKHKWPESSPEPPGCLPLREGAAALLAQRALSAQPRKQPAVGQHMLIDPRQDPARAAEAFEDLRFYATQVRVAAAIGAPGQASIDGDPAAADEYVYLFHVLDDADRRGAFEAPLGAGYLDGCIVLAAYESAGRLVFLPRDLEPHAESLDSFARLVDARPELFGGPPDPSGAKEHRLLAAIVPDETLGATRRVAEAAVDRAPQEPAPPSVSAPPHSCTALYLRHLSFKAQFVVGPPVASHIRLRLLDLCDSRPALNELTRAVAGAQPRAGYRLKLGDSTYIDADEEERTRLYDRKVSIEQRLAVLNSLSRPRPRLFRFTQRQLPALGALVLDAMEKGSIGAYRYAFQPLQSPVARPASADWQAGLHFIYALPGAPPDAPETWWPLWDRAATGDEPMRFWLDPAWASYYADDNRGCAIFVPERQALYPPLHGWDPDEMDRYLREMLGHWFAETGQAVDLPRRPLYIFEGRDKMEVTVLDRDQFQPLGNCIAWLNDNLALVKALGGGKRAIKQMAESQRGLNKLAQLQSQAQTAAAEYQRASSEAASAIGGALSGLEQDVARELDALRGQIEQQIEAFRSRLPRLHALEAALGDMKKLEADLERLENDACEKNKQLATYEGGLGAEVRAAVESAGELRARLAGELDAEIAALARTSAGLRTRLAELEQRP